ncbi:MAG: DUF11 domain-containing protein, partial [Cyclobacteriaceae bacterium]|nr:DUF11 domain-containing protein [Cyclobacteriaceae bacterium]MDX5465669.1 DUF11 domain-containing protein [Cyclobacteriaceae bacterium]
VWYDAATGGNVVANPTKNTVGTVTYYAEAVNNTTDCKSLTRTPVSLTINAAPAAPVSGGNQVVCETDPIQNLTATATVPQGFSVVWYDAAVSGNVVANPNKNTVGSVTYYAQAVNNTTGCASLTRTAVTLTILNAPTPPLSNGNIIICEGDAEKITASATAPGNIVWYDAAVGGNVVADPSLSTVGTVTYYAQSVGTSCSSLERTPVILTILPAPVAPVSGGNQTVCFFEQGQTLTATASVPQGFNIVWYNAPTGGNVVANPSLNTLGTVTYYAEAVNAQTGCSSLGRTPVTLTFNSCSISLTKTPNVQSVNNAGDVIIYTLTVTNTGNAILNNVTVVDPLTGFNQNIGSLAGGQSSNLETSYTATQSDIDAGSILNVATANGVANNSQVSAQAEAVVTAIQNPAINIEITDNNPVLTNPGDEIPYTIVVTNTGNVTLENVTVVDTVTGTVVNVGTLAPGESKTIEANYPITQEDIDRGSVTNEATATGESPNQGDDNPTDTDEVTTPITPVPGIQLNKTADKNVIREAGEVVNYTLTVTNTGNVTLYDVTVSDPMTGLNEDIGSIAPGESVSVETEYVVTAEDLEGENLVNLASVTGTLPDGETKIGDEDTETVGVGANEIIANDDEYGTFFLRFGGVIGNILDNDLLKGQRPDPADVDFEFTDLDGIVGLLINENGELSLIPGVNEIRDYTLRYVLRETANPSNSDDAFVVFRIVNNDANLSVTKEALSDEIFEGDVFDYQIVVSNIGETDATNVVVTDNIPSGVTYQSYTVVNNTSGSTVTPTISGNNVSFAIPFMAAGTSVTINIKVKAGAAGTVSNTVVVGSDEDDIDETDNEASDVSQIRPFRIPNVITPNGDGKNDTFEIKGLGKYLTNELVILNRLGDHVLEVASYQNDWNAPGQFSGTYFYVLKVTDASGNQTDFTGWIQVIKD